MSENARKDERIGPEQGTESPGGPSTVNGHDTGASRGPAAYRYGDQRSADSLMLEELLRGTEIHQLFESYYNLIKIPVAIIDLDANVLFSSRWQRICTQFHRVHPTTCARCVECDTKLAGRLQAGQVRTIYPCLNGLTDSASPIVIEGRHIANLFIGQFLTEAPHEAHFRRQAEEFGFDIADYLAALREVPIVDQKAIPSILDLLARMTRVITTLSIERKHAIDDHARQSLVLDTIPQSVFWKDLQGRYLGCNAPFARAAGLGKPGDVVGKSDSDLPWPRAEADAYRADDQAVIAAGRPRLHFIEPIQKADGSRIVADTSKLPLTDSTGTAYGVLGIFDDITERKRIEDELNASEDRYRKLFEASPDGIILVGSDGRVERANTAQASLYRYDSPAEMLGMHATQFITPPMKEYAAENMRRRLGGEDLPRVEYECVRKDGSTFLAEVVVTNLRRPDGTVSGYICTTRDITERRRAGEALRDNELKYRALFETADDAILLFTDNRWIDCNQAASRVFGCTREQILGAHPREFSPPTQPDGRDSTEESIRRIELAYTLGPQTFEWTHCRADGTLFPAEVSLNRLDLAGKPHMQAIVRDVSERKRAEKELHEAQTLHSSIINSTNDMIWSVDPEHFGLLSFNHGLSDYFLKAGVKLEAGMRPEDMVPSAEFRERWHALYRRALAEGGYREEYTGIAGGAILDLTFGLLRRAGNVFGISVFAKDIAERKRADQELQERLRIETLVAELAARFVAVDVDNLDRELQFALKRICASIDIDVCGIWQIPDSDSSTLVLTHMFRRMDGPPIPSEMRARDYFPWVEEWLRTTGSSFALSDVADLPPEAVRDREVYALFGIESALCVPSLGADGTLTGVVSCNCTAKRTWTPLVVSRVQMLSRIILMALARIRGERGMAASRERMRLLTEMLDEAPAGVLVHDEDGRVLYTNRHAASLHGYTADELGKLSLADLVAQDARDDVRQHLREILERGEVSFDIWHMTKDRSAIHLHVVARRVRWLDRPAVLSVQADLTERERSANALRESEGRYRLLAERIADVVWVLDPSTGKCLYVSPSVERLRGYTVEEAMAQPLEASLASESREPMRARAYEALQVLSGGSHVGSFGMHIVHQTRKDGSTVPTEVTMECIRDQATGKPLILGVSRDITERMQAEKARQELQAQLNQAQKMEAIGSLAGGVAHDFNNLVSVILSYTGFVLNDLSERDPRRKDLEEVRKAAGRAAELTRQLLAFSRKQVFQPVPLDLNQIALGVEKMLRRIVGEDIDFVHVLAPDLGVTLADPGQIEQVLMNLVVNARDAMPGGGKLTIETRNVELGEIPASILTDVKPGAYVELLVTDTGCGMGAETQARIFEPFFTTKEKGKGTGLGLSTVFGIVKQSGGDVQVVSEPGRGTTFKIDLPRELAATAPMASNATVAPALATGNETVLVVEDEEALRNVARRALTEAGYNVLVAANGKEALRVCEQRPGKIHLVLTDVVMPEMGGSILTSRLASTCPEAKVLFMSGYTDDAIVHHGVLDPGIHFIAKPFTPPDLAQKVREVLDGGSTAPSRAHVAAVQAPDELAARPSYEEAVRALPRSIVDGLCAAVSAARHDKTIEIVESIRGTAPALATELRRMAELFDYDGIRDLLESKGT